jgi:serine/threonine protein kinase
MTPVHDDAVRLGTGTLRTPRGIRSADPAAPADAAQKDPEPSDRQAPKDTPQAPAAPLQPPARFGVYELVQEVARGGMGVIYKAHHGELQRTVALKMILDGSLNSEEARERFHREARAAAALDHPNIVPIHDIGSHDGRSFFTMAFVDGPNLKQAVRDHGLPAPRDAVRLLLAVADAVGYAHDCGVIHRDLKPENILLDPQGRPRVADFGLAKLSGPGDPSLTASGQMIGTPTYMPPEQAAGQADKIGPHTDVYSLGGVLYFLLTGEPPFRGQSVTEVLAQVMSEEPRPPRQLNPQAPEPLEAICLKCLNKDPARRYPSAAALAEELRAARLPEECGDPARLPGAAVSPVTAPLSWRTGTPPSTMQGLKGWRKGALVTAAAVAALAAAGLWWGRGGKPTPAPEPTPSPTPTKPAAVLPLPDRLRRDFALQVTALAGPSVGADMRPLQPGADGIFRLLPGQKVQFEVTVDRAAYVGVWSLEADGKTVYQLFPNRDDPDHAFKAGEKRRVPVQGADAVESMSLDQLWVEASTDRWEPLQGEEEGQFRRFQSERGGQGVQVRGLRLPEKNRAESVVQYRVGASAP